MPRRRPSHSGGLLDWIGSPPAWLALIAIIGGGTGFYWKTTGAIDALTNRTEEDHIQREALRKSLSDNADKTSVAIGQLTTHAAIQDERTKTISESLNKITDQLTTLNAVTSVHQPKK